MEVPRLGTESELKLPAYSTATATPDPSHICDLHYSSWQCQMLNPLSEARDQTLIGFSIAELQCELLKVCLSTSYSQFEINNWLGRLERKIKPGGYFCNLFQYSIPSMWKSVLPLMVTRLSLFILKT